MKAYKLFHDKRIHENGAIEERIVWLVPKSLQYPEGVKYSLVYTKPGERPKVLYDNHYPKGHHKHLLGKEFPYSFTTYEKLIADFDKDIEEVI